MKKHKGCLAGIVVAVVVLLIFVFTCPSANKHKEVIAATMNTAVSNIATEEYGIIGTMGSMLAGGVVSAAMSELVTVDDYIVCSVGRLPYEGDSIVVSFGILNHVFTIHSDIIEKRLRGITDTPPLHE